MNKQTTHNAGSDRRFRKGIYLLPNIFTLGALFSGFYSIISSSNQHFYFASWAIVVAMFLDSLDGRVARLTNTQTEFGSQLDSLSDLVSFGLAPALLSFFWLLHSLGKPGWLCCFVYTAFTALRLARFNSDSENACGRYFYGLCSPIAAGSVAMFVLLVNQYGFHNSLIVYVLFLLLTFLGLLMVSTVRYRSYKDINADGKVPFTTIVMILLVLVLVFLSPVLVLFLLFSGYALAGPLLYVFRILKSMLLSKKNSGIKSRPDGMEVNDDIK